MWRFVQLLLIYTIKYVIGVFPYENETLLCIIVLIVFLKMTLLEQFRMFKQFENIVNIFVKFTNWVTVDFVNFP